MSDTTPASSSIAPPVPPLRPPRLRFTLGGMFVFTLGIASGLAWWRLPNASIAQFLFGCFTAWLVTGLIQRSRRAWQLFHQAPPHSTAETAGWIIAITVPCCIAVLLVFAVVMEAERRIEWWSRDRDVDVELQFASSWLMYKLSYCLFFFAILCAYWPGKPWGDCNRRESRTGTYVVVAGTILAAACLVIYSFTSITIISEMFAALYHFEHLYQQRHFAGHLMHSRDLPAEELKVAFVHGGLLAGVFLSGAVGSVGALARWEGKGLLYKLLLVAGAACLVATTWLVVWCARVALPALSPLISAAAVEQPQLNLYLGAILAVSASGAASLLLVGRLPTTAPQEYSRHGPHVHERMAVILLPIFALCWEVVGAFVSQRQDSAQGMWYYLFDVPFYQVEPEHLLQLAVCIVLVPALWRAQHGQPSPMQIVWMIEPRKLLVVWLLITSSMLLAPLVGTWFGVALMLHAGMP